MRMKENKTILKTYFGLLLSSHSPSTLYQPLSSLWNFGNRRPCCIGHCQPGGDCYGFRPPEIVLGHCLVKCQPLFSPLWAGAEVTMSDGRMRVFLSPSNLCQPVNAFPPCPRICHPTSANWGWQIRTLAWCFCWNDPPWSSWCWHSDCQQTSSLALQLEEWVHSHFPLSYCSSSLWTKQISVQQFTLQFHFQVEGCWAFLQS